MSWAVALILTGSAMYTAADTGQVNEDMSSTSLIIVHTVNDVIDFIKAHPERCYSGIFTQSYSWFLNQNVNIALQDYACGFRPGRPYYMVPATPQSAGAEAHLDLSVFNAGWKNILPELKFEQETDSLRPYLKVYPANIHQARSGQPNSGRAAIRWSAGDVSASQVLASFSSEDDWPQMNNVGLALRAGAQSLYFLLQDNNLVVLASEGPAPAHALAQTQLGEIKKDFTLRLVDVDRSCLVFMDNYLLLQIDRCFTQPVQVGVMNYDNGSPAEKLLALTYR